MRTKIFFAKLYVRRRDVEGAVPYGKVRGFGADRVVFCFWKKIEKNLKIKVEFSKFHLAV